MGEGSWGGKEPHCCWSAKNSATNASIRLQETMRSVGDHSGTPGRVEVRRRRYAGEAIKKR